MRQLEMYKRLSKEDRKNLITYCIYDAIYDVMRNENTILDDNTVDGIKDVVYDLYVEDDIYNLSQSEIAHFITECYINDNNFFKLIDNISYSDVLEAINDKAYDFYRKIEMEV